jgi:hypothetical protein
MDKQKQLIIGIAIILAIVLLGPKLGLFTIGSPNSIYKTCAEYLPEATYGAVAGECYVYTLSNVQSIRYVNSVFDRQTTSGPMCQVDVSQPSATKVCADNKVYTGEGMTVNYCNSDSDCPGTICTYNFCSERPVNQCATPGSRTCVSGDSSKYLECLSSLRWSGNLNCASGTECSGGQCVRTCTESDWSSGLSPTVCPSSGTQTRIWQKVNTCAGGVQKTNEEVSCTYVAPALSNCTNSDYTSTVSPANCPSSGTQTKTYTKIGNCAGTKNPETLTCNPNTPNCTYSYSNWTVCRSTGTQSRTETHSPAVCQGTPVLTQSCNYVEPSPGTATCDDEIKNQNETGIDCGGSCDACEKSFFQEYTWYIIGGIGLLVLVLLLKK